MRILSIGADRSKRGILFPGSDAFKRQEAYAKQFGNLDIVAFSLKKDGAKIIDASALRIFPTNSSSKLLWGLDARRIAKHLPKPDVVSVQDPFETGLVGYFIARYFKVPLHVQVHTDFLSPAYARHSLLNGVRLVIAGFVLRRARGIRVVSERIKKGVEEMYHPDAPISVLPIFVDVERFRTAQPPNILSDFKNRVLIVARQEPEKNVELGIRAFLRTAPPDTCLIVVGKGSEHERLTGIARQEKKTGVIFFHDTEDVAPYYALADLVLVPSKYEGYGLVIIEALAAGKPVLSTDVGIAREAGAIVASSEKFAAALSDWFKNGPREASLKNYPYRTFHDYVHQYCEDVTACVKAQKTQY